MGSAQSTGRVSSARRRGIASLSLLLIVLTGTLIAQAPRPVQNVRILRDHSAVSNVSASAITPASATILWTTAGPSDSRVEYGLTASFGSTTAVNTTLVTAHSVQLSGLTSGTQYFFRVH